MKAAIYKSTGDATDVLEVVDIEKPTPLEGQVLVKIHASGINPTDTKTRAGIFPIQGKWDRIVPHHDGAGIIASVGKGVSNDRIGERVWLHSTQWAGADGTAAEYAVVGSTNAISLPDNVDFSSAATFGVPLLTAYHAVTMDGSSQGKTILIQGGAGAVGNYAIQIAKEKGAKVITTVSSSLKAEAAKLAGADHVIDYKKENVVERVRELTEGAGVDHIVEVNLSANAHQLPDLIKNGGFVTVYGTDEFMSEFPAVGAVIQQMRFGFFIVFMLPQEVLDHAIRDLTEMLKDDKINAAMGASFPLQKIAAAHDFVDASSTIGNVIVTFD